MKLIDLTGKKFGRYTVVDFLGRIKKISRWNCICECGTKNDVPSRNLLSGRSKSCGCFRDYKASLQNRTHGKHKTSTYRSWVRMKTRCQNKKHEQFNNYGGRGIKVCSRWSKFENFYYDMGERPSDTSLDRINVNGNYSPSNCRWATSSTQQNNKMNSCFVKHNGETKTVSEWAKILGIGSTTLDYRIKSGLPIKECFERPIKRGKPFIPRKKKNQKQNTSSTITSTARSQ